jgi:hypothetical protein
MSPIVSASHRCSTVVTVSRVTDSRMVMGAGLGRCGPGVKADDAKVGMCP